MLGHERKQNLYHSNKNKQNLNCINKTAIKTLYYSNKNNKNLITVINMHTTAIANTKNKTNIRCASLYCQVKWFASK